ncbi:hypothetical protein L596_026825 [Steinernema carpocapsae]|uniref:Uncharacterized protein n=1 Tax=Steinernema carpocapsae TaxID=34508 RepID=A0A4U5M2I2_STECR|nr:hypothetical protein L596_026825 [Steinernema carpocapsae]
MRLVDNHKDDTQLLKGLTDFLVDHTGSSKIPNKIKMVEVIKKVVLNHGLRVEVREEVVRNVILCGQPVSFTPVDSSFQSRMPTSECLWET